MPQELTQAIEVSHPENRQLTYLVVNSEFYLDLFTLNIGSGGSPIVTHIKKIKAKADCICSSLEQPGFFFISHLNKIQKCQIDLGRKEKVTVLKQKILFCDNDQVKVTAMKQTFLQSETAGDSNESMIAVATSDYDFIILSIG